MSNNVLHENPVSVAHLRTSDPVLASIIAQIGAYRLERQAAGFWALVDSIVAQQISVRAAAAIMQRLNTAIASREPADLLALSSPELRALGLSNQKTRYIHDLASRIESGQLKLDRLNELDDEAAIAELVQVKGIGRWTAQMYLIFALGRPDVLPVDDLGLRQAIQRHYAPVEPLSAATINAIGEPWRPYRSVATWYLWKSLRNEPRRSG